MWITAFQDWSALPGSDARSCESALFEGPFEPGLPAEFGNSVMNALSAWATTHLASGTVVIDRAGFDRPSASDLGFRHATLLLMHALNAISRGDDPEEALRAQIPLLS